MKPWLNLNSDFLRSVVVLTSGTVLAQLIGYLLAPIITRMYNPEEMGEFGFYLRIVTLIATIATARYELSIPLPKNEQHSFQLFRLSLRITLITSIITFGFSLVYMALKGFQTDAVFISLAVVFGTFFLVFFNLGTSWSIRTKAFRNISISKVTNSLSMNGLRVLFGFFHFGTYGLLISFIVSLIAGSYFFFTDFYENSRKKINAASKKKMYVLSKIYRDFPRINLPHALSDNFRDLLVAFIIVHFFSEEIFGSFDHSFRMLRLPLMVIGASMSQVFFNKASEMYNSDKPLLPLVRKMIKSLILISIVPFSIVFFWGEDLFAFVFGSAWRQSGIISEIMTPWLLFNFIASPLSTLPIILGKQKQFFIIGIIGSVLQIAGFGILPMLGDENNESLYFVFKVVSGSQVLLYLVILFFIVRITRNSDATISR